jgi:hypothetical protein
MFEDPNIQTKPWKAESKSEPLVNTTKIIQQAKTAWNRKVLPYFTDEQDTDKQSKTQFKPKVDTVSTKTYDYILGEPIQDYHDDKQVYQHRSKYIDLTNPKIKTAYHNRGDKKGDNQPFKQVLFSNFDNNVFDDIHYLKRTNKLNPSGFYIGTSSEGKLIMGTGAEIANVNGAVSKFSIIKNVKGFKKDPKTGYKIKKSPDSAGHDTPFFDTDSGDVVTNILTSRSKSRFDEYGDVSGGSFIMMTPDKKVKVLASGSANELSNAIEKFKKDNKVEKLDIIKVDNGSYARTWNTNRNIVDQKFWDTYEGQNTRGGNAIYEYKNGGYVDSVLNANKNLEWVKRLYDENPQSIMLPGESNPSTHFMESSDNLVYPTIIQNGEGKLEYLGKGARDYAIKNKTFIEFPTENDAIQFGKNYKSGTGVLKGFQDGGVIEDNRGQWAHPGEITKINSNQITMQGVPYPVLGISDTGDKRMMYPGKDYQFKGNSVTEYPQIAQKGFNGKTAWQNSLDQNLEAQRNSEALRLQQYLDQKSKEDAFKQQQAIQSNSKVVPAKKQGAASKALEVAANPVAAIRSMNEKGYISDNFSKGETSPATAIDAGLAYFNPAFYTSAAIRTGKNMVNPTTYTNAVKTPFEIGQVMTDGYAAPGYEGSALSTLGVMADAAATGYAGSQLYGAGLKYGPQAYKINPLAEKNPLYSNTPHEGELIMHPDDKSLKAYIYKARNNGNPNSAFYVNKELRKINEWDPGWEYYSMSARDIQKLRFPESVVGKPHWFDGWPAAKYSNKPKGDLFHKIEDIKSGLEKALNENSITSQAWKLNPMAFKENPKMLYRGIGESGAKDALSYGAFRPKQGVFDMTNLNQKFFDKTYWGPKLSTAESYGKGIIAEVPQDAANFTNRYSRGKDWSKLTTEEIPVDKGKIYKKDWLQRYKEIPESKAIEDIKGMNEFNFDRFQLGHNIALGQGGAHNDGVWLLKRPWNNYVMKVDEAEKFSNTIDNPGYTNFDFVKPSKDLNPAGVSKIYNQFNLGDGKRALIQNRLTGKPMTALNVDDIMNIPEKSWADMLKSLNSVRKNDLSFDFHGNNFYYDPVNKKFKLFDLGPNPEMDRTSFNVVNNFSSTESNEMFKLKAAELLKTKLSNLAGRHMNNKLTITPEEIDNYSNYLINDFSEMIKRQKFKKGGAVAESTGLNKIYPLDKITPNSKLLKNIQLTSEGFMQEWQSSPMYKKMLKESLKGETEQSLENYRPLNWTITNWGHAPILNPNNINTSSDNNIRGYYTSGPDSIYIKTNILNDKRGFSTGVHEDSHSSDSGGWRIPEKDKQKIDKYKNITPPKYFGKLPWYKQILYDKNVYNKSVKDYYDYQKYVADPTETRARLNNIRYLGLSEGIYDPFTQPIGRTSFEAIKNIRLGSESSPIDELKTIYTDEEIIDMLNSISMNENKSEEVTKAQLGTMVKIKRNTQVPTSKAESEFYRTFSNAKGLGRGFMTYDHSPQSGWLHTTPKGETFYSSDEYDKNNKPIPWTNQDSPMEWTDSYDDTEGLPDNNGGYHMKYQDKTGRNYYDVSRDFPSVTPDKWNTARFAFAPFFLKGGDNGGWMYNTADGGNNPMILPDGDFKKKRMLMEDIYKYNLSNPDLSRREAWKDSRKFVNKEVMPLVNSDFYKHYKQGIDLGRVDSITNSGVYEKLPEKEAYKTLVDFNKKFRKMNPKEAKAAAKVNDMKFGGKVEPQTKIINGKKYYLIDTEDFK